MIITVTLNPAMDKTMVVDGIEIGEVNRADSARNDIGGKGINVSKVLKSFETDSLATGFLRRHHGRAVPQGTDASGHRGPVHFHKGEYKNQH